jgi:hypothetical protein
MSGISLEFIVGLAFGRFLSRRFCTAFLHFDIRGFEQLMGIASAYAAVRCAEASPRKWKAEK